MLPKIISTILGLAAAGMFIGKFKKTNRIEKSRTLTEGEIRSVVGWLRDRSVSTDEGG